MFLSSVKKNYPKIIFFFLIIVSCQKKQTEIELLNKKDPIGLYGENIIAEGFFSKINLSKNKQ